MDGCVDTIDIKIHNNHGSDPYFDEIRKSFVREHVGPSRRILPQIVSTEVEFAIVDGGHSYADVQFDIRFLVNRLSKNGAILLDDCVDDYAGVQKAAAQSETRYGLKFRTFYRLGLLTWDSL